MLARYTIAGLAVSALLATAALAQTPAATTSDRAGMAPSNTSNPKASDTKASDTKASDTKASDTSSSLQKDWATSKLVGLAVYNSNDESLGSINDLLTDKGGNIKAVVVGVGGFLGVGEHLVAVPFDKIKFVNEPMAYTGVAGGQPAAGTRPASSTTTGAATTSAAPAPAAAKPNPWYPDHALYNATKDELKALPEFTYSN